MTDIPQFFEYEDPETKEKYYFNTKTEETQYEFPEDGIIFDPETREVIYSPLQRKRAASINESSPTISPASSMISEDFKNRSLTVAPSAHSPYKPSELDLPGSGDITPNASESLIVSPSPGPYVNSTITIPAAPAPAQGQIGPLKKVKKHKRMPVANPMAPAMAETPEIVNPHVTQQLKSPTINPGSSNAAAIANPGNPEPEQSGGFKGKFKNKKEEKPKRVKRSKTVRENEVVGSLDQKQLFDSIHHFQTPDFAKKYFKEHRCGGFFSRRVMPIDELISYTTEPLRDPLLSSLPKTLSKLAVQCFEDILLFTGARPGRGASLIPSKLVNLLYSVPGLRDEVYFQLVKQTTNCPDQPVLERSWELFLILATLFPSTRDSEVWLQAHIARNSQAPIQKVAQLAHFTYIRFEARCCLGEPAVCPKMAAIPAIARDPFVSHLQFGVSLYEVMWSQRQTYTKLPFPYIEYLLIELIKSKGGMEVTGIFRLPGNLKLVGEMAEDVKDSFNCLEQASIHDLGSLLKRWFRDLANPVVPAQSLEDFRRAYEARKLIDFVEGLPKTHMCTLMYLIGFLQECARHSGKTQMHAKNLAIVFGPNVVQVNDNEPGRIQLFSQMGNDFVLQLIEEWDTSEIYPLDESFLH